MASRRSVLKSLLGLPLLPLIPKLAVAENPCASLIKEIGTGSMMTGELGTMQGFNFYRERTDVEGDSYYVLIGSDSSELFEAGAT